MSTKDVGNISEAMILAALVRTGHALLRPFGDNLRYDLAIDDGGKLIRVQCKTGKLKRGAVEFSASSSQCHRGRGRQNYRGQADVFGVYCPQLNKAYLIPVSDCGLTRCRLRIQPARNGQRTHIRDAKRYEIA